jgi:hypothetical protein
MCSSSNSDSDDTSIYELLGNSKSPMTTYELSNCSNYMPSDKLNPASRVVNFHRVTNKNTVEDPDDY